MPRSSSIDQSEPPHGLSAEALDALRRRLHDGLCQHLAASALLQTVVTNRLEEAASLTLSEAELCSLGENARRVKELLYEALDETRAVLNSLN